MTVTEAQKPRGRKAAQPRWRRLEAAERRAQLLRGVEEVFADFGWAGTTVPRVVAAAGLAQGSFYRHFKHIDDAVVQLTRAVLEPVRQAALSLDFASVQTVGQLERELVRFYSVLARQLRDHPVVVAEALLAGAFARGPLGEEMSAFLEAMQAHAYDLAVRHMARPPFREVDATIVAAAIVGMVIGAVRTAVQLQNEFDPERWAVEMARFEAGALVHGYTPASSRSEI